jgi:phosphoribosyl 1,2-cyclic phosphodiesterase
MERLVNKKNLNRLARDDAEWRSSFHLLFTHYHWDHLQGFPFHAPAFLIGPARIKIDFYGKTDARRKLSQVLAGQQQYPNFPIVWEDMPCEKQCHELPRLDNSEPIRIGDAIVRYQELSHPDQVFAYSIAIQDKKFVIATDTEHREVPDPRLVEFGQGAQILYYDAQYLPEEYSGGTSHKVDWGHSTYEWGVRTALAANIGTVVMGHHDPSRDDAMLEEIDRRANAFRDEQLRLPKNRGKTLKIIMAYQGLELKL